MMYGSPTTKQETLGPRKDKFADRENRLAEAFHQMMMEDFRFMEAARIQSGEYNGTTISTEDLKPPEKIRDIMLKYQYGLVNFASYYTTQIMIKDEVFDIRMKRFRTQISSCPPLAIWAHWVLSTKAFSIIMFLIICLSSLLMCIEGELIDLPEYTTIIIVIDTIDFLFLLMFLAEILLKWADNFWGFWQSYWNWFDFIVTSLSFVAPFMDIVFYDKAQEANERFDFGLSVVRYVRLTRILRSLNVVTRLRKIWIIWAAITRTFTALVFITFLILIFFYIFAIVGIQVFDRFSKTHIPNLRYVDRFSDVSLACLTLFQVFTIDHWWPILQDLVVVQGYVIPTIYMMTWLLLGTIIFNNFFAGVMVNYFQNISQELLEETSSITGTTKLGVEMNVFGMDEIVLPQQVVDPMTDWETNVFHNIEVLKASGYVSSPSLWSRDTLFQYYIILEALSSNLYERDQLLYLLNQALLRHYEP